METLLFVQCVIAIFAKQLHDNIRQGPTCACINHDCKIPVKFDWVEKKFIL